MSVLEKADHMLLGVLLICPEYHTDTLKMAVGDLSAIAKKILLKSPSVKSFSFIQESKL